MPLADTAQPPDNTVLRYLWRHRSSASFGRRFEITKQHAGGVLHDKRAASDALIARVHAELAAGVRGPHDVTPAYVIAALDGVDLVAVLATPDHRPAIFRSKDLADTVGEIIRLTGLAAYPLPAWSDVVARLTMRGAEAAGREPTDVDPIYMDGTGDTDEDAGRRIGRFVAEHVRSAVLLAELETLYSLPDAAVDSGAA